jgi:RNA polymerase sigma-70 factor (ECF subfamily)
LKRKIVDHYRRKKNWQETDIESVEADLFDDQGHWRSLPTAWDMNPDTAYERKEFVHVLYQCLSALPSRLAEIFMMREFDDLATETICKNLKITESNSWVMLFRARMQLKKCLEKTWITGDREV